VRDLPNYLSLWRLLITIPLVVLVLLDRPWAYLAAFGLYVLGSASDYLDGRLARRYEVVSNLGVFLDLTADKVYVAALLVALVQVALVPAWVVVIIVSREFIVTGMRSLAASEGVVIPAGRWGKQKTAITLVALGGILLWRGLGGSASFPLGFDPGAGAASTVVDYLLVASDAIMLLAVIWTIFSAVEYLVGAWPVLKRQASQV
jgi:CDP-diacylglycerol--glycerol-3-phosphate 3-phosphatidyltransferase